MKCFALLVMLLGATAGGHAQDILVRASKNAYYVSGEKIRKGQPIDLGKKISVLKNGELIYQYKQSEFTLKSGVYNFDSLFTVQKKHVDIDDSIRAYLKSKNLVNCQESIQCRRVTNATKNTSIETSNYSILLTWDDVKTGYTGKYHVVIRDLFNDYLGLVTSDQKEILLDLRPFKPESAILYQVLSEGCFQSDLMLIKMN